ncbi:DUF6019 family protein [Tepidibacillus marianensis]
MLANLGISTGSAIIILIVLYFVIKWAVKNGINESMLFLMMIEERNLRTR